MRKYFLLTTAALLAATNAIADDGAATVQVEAKLIEPTTITCTTLNFGTLKVKRGTSRGQFVMSTTGEISTNSSSLWVLLDAINATPATCTLNEAPITIMGNASGKAYLNDEGTIYADYFKITDGVLTASLFISEDVEITGKQLRGSTTISFFYE